MSSTEGDDHASQGTSHKKSQNSITISGTAMLFGIQGK